MLTWAQKKAMFTLKEAVDVNSAASLMRLSPKTLYTYSRQIGEKLNLNSLFQVRQFFFAEFAHKRAALTRPEIASDGGIYANNQRKHKVLGSVPRR